LTVIRSWLSKANFSFGGNPKIERRKEWRKFIPEPYKAFIIISADFELAWAWQYAKTQNPYQLSIEKAKQARQNIPKILNLCETYNIPITWATIGHLFLESCQKRGNVPHPKINRLNHFENNYWKFKKGDWFQHDPCSNFKENSEWYAPDLIKLILERSVKHEIGCHTFSHIDCSDDVCPSEVFNSEIEACKSEAEKLGLQLKTFVHPAHTIGNLDNLIKQGFTSFRTDYRNVLGYPIKHNNGLWEFQQTAEFVYRKEWSINYHIYRYKKIIDRAIKSNTVCYFWFHPSFDSIFVEKIMPEIYKYIAQNRDKIYITTTGEYVEMIERR
jgi:peptidoglycan/xylan/chitin deacetylase (PgdA/CDA1 family)